MEEKGKSLTLPPINMDPRYNYIRPRMTQLESGLLNNCNNIHCIHNQITLI